MIYSNKRIFSASGYYGQQMMKIAGQMPKLRSSFYNQQKYLQNDEELGFLDSISQLTDDQALEFLSSTLHELGSSTPENESYTADAAKVEKNQRAQQNNNQAVHASGKARDSGASDADEQNDYPQTTETDEDLYFNASPEQINEMNSEFHQIIAEELVQTTSEIREKERYIAELQAETTRLQGELAQCKLACSGRKDCAGQLTRQGDEIRRLRALCNAKDRHYRETFAEAQAKFDQLYGVLQGCQGRLAQQYAQLSAGEIERCKRECAQAAQAQIDAKDEELRRLRSESDARVRQADALLQEQQQKYAAAAEERQAMARRLEALQNEQYALAQANTHLESQLIDARQRLSAIDDGDFEKLTPIDMKQEEIDQLTQQASDYQRKIEQLEAEMDLQRTQNDRAKLEEFVDQLQTLNNELEQQNQRQQLEIQQLRADAILQQQERSKLNAQAEEYYQGCLRQISELREYLQSITQECKKQKEIAESCIANQQRAEKALSIQAIQFQKQIASKNAVY